VAVSLSVQNGRLTLEIVDDGGGFDVTGPDGSSNRLGLASMRERSRAVKGQLSVISSSETGTRVRLTAPIDGETGGDGDD
jgi:signal transduction histidine kinase